MKKKKNNIKAKTTQVDPEKQQEEPIKQKTTKDALFEKSII